MGRRGPRPTPTRLKLLFGVHPYRINKNEPQPARMIPPMPDWLDDEAQREWNRVAPVLYMRGLLTEADGGVLAAYCDAVGMVHRCQRRIKRQGLQLRGPDGRVYIHPLAAVAQQAQQLALRLAAEFGMTARTRLIAPPDPKPRRNTPP
jgi:P27 family predicted phage terminase small subunit